MDTIKAAAILRRILQHTDESAAAAEREQRRSAGEGQFSLAWAAQIDMFNRREEEQAIVFVLERLERPTPADVQTLRDRLHALGRLAPSDEVTSRCVSDALAAVHRLENEICSPVTASVLEQAEQALVELGAKADNKCAPGHCQWQRASVALRNVRGVLGIKS